MQDEIKDWKMKADYFEEGNQKLHALHETRTHDLQNKLNKCENQNKSIYGRQSNNQICERKIEGDDQTSFQSYRKNNFKATL